MRHIYVVILTKYVVNSTIPYIILYYNLLYDYGLLLKSLEPLYAHTCFMIFFIIHLWTIAQHIILFYFW